MRLSEEKTIPSRAGASPMHSEDAEDLAMQVPEWIMEDNKIVREFKLKDFKSAIDFVNDVADIAETEDHHPDICISYNKVKLELSTHKIGGLSRNDFILAAKIDKLL
ncbi:MAG: 4a-hydroxytetrahydrobiopterin dehydratase [Armatimonadota bacterium]